MKLLSIEELRSLIRQPAQISVSLFLSTTNMAWGQLQNPTRLRHLVHQAEEQLLQKGMRSDAAKAFLQPILDLDQPDFWQHQSTGLAIFCSAEALYYYCLPLEFTDFVMVNDQFYVLPLMPLFNQDGLFYLLALSQQQIRLLRCTQYSSVAIDVTELIPRVSEALRFEAPERQISHTGTPGAVTSRRRASGGATIFHGHGAGDEAEKDYLRQYFGQVDQALRAVLREDHIPLVLAGVDYLLPIYHQANTYPNLIANGVLGNPEHLSDQELCTQGWRVVEPHFQHLQKTAIAHYTELQGSARTTHDIHEIVPAACQGRIQTLWVAQHQQVWGTYDPTAQHVTVYAQPELNSEELLNGAVVETLLHQGQVYVVPPDQMPEAGAIAAILRYSG